MEKEKCGLESTPIKNEHLNLQRTAYKVYTAAELVNADLEPPEFVIPGLITTGLAILAGKPKMGKSLLAMNLSVSSANGGNALGVIETESRGVLYLALEDTGWKLKAKLAQILNEYPATDNLHFALQWTRMDANFFSDLEAFLKDHPEIKLIIIDTYTKIRGTKRCGATLYEKDYHDAARLKSFADEHQIAILLIHHIRKSEGRDVLDMISGSVGITGAADTILVLTRGRGEDEANLYVTGRDIAEASIGLKFSKQTLTWEVSGSAAEQKMSAERREILEFLDKSDTPLKLSEIAEALEKKTPVTHKHLAALIADGLIEKPSYGLYQVVKVADIGESGEPYESVSQQLDIITD